MDDIEPSSQFFAYGTASDTASEALGEFHARLYNSEKGRQLVATIGQLAVADTLDMLDPAIKKLPVDKLSDSELVNLLLDLTDNGMDLYPGKDPVLNKAIDDSSKVNDAIDRIKSYSQDSPEKNNARRQYNLHRLKVLGSIVTGSLVVVVPPNRSAFPPRAIDVTKNLVDDEAKIAS